MRRMICSILAAAAACLLVGSPALARPAGAIHPTDPATQSTTCDLTAIGTFKPGLGLLKHTQKITLSGSLTSCVGGGVTGASGKGKGSGSLSCTSGSGTAKVQLTWDNSQQSLLSLTVDVSSGTLSGQVIKGLFAGEQVTGSGTLTPIKGNCLTSPVTKAQVTGTAGL